jgi:hypothetical protein
VLDGQDGHDMVLVIDAVDHAVIAAPGAEEFFQPEPDRLANSARVVRSWEL